MTRKSSLLSSAFLVLALALVGSLGVAALIGPAGLPTGSLLAQVGAPAPPAGAQGSGVTVEFLGWSHYRLTSPSGKVVVTNPFINNNPDAAITLDEAISRGADLILVPNGHGDEQGNTLELAQAIDARVVTGAFELSNWFAQKGVPRPQLSFTSPGDVYRHEGITVRVLGGQHGSSLPSPSDTVYYGGPASSFMITFENGFTVYFSGSIAATQDMAWWADLYKPDAAIVHQSAAHEPRDAAMIVKFMTNNNPNLKTVFPHHHRLQPQPGGLFRPADLRTEIERMGINVTFIDPNPLQPYTLTK
jgi:L-ascorbate metabolism protein UlaG (beta-lactamase superfamily)